jgi:hypothetical protein
LYNLSARMTFMRSWQFAWYPETFARISRLLWMTPDDSPGHDSPDRPVVTAVTSPYTDTAL